MLSSLPNISVIVCSYNHAKWVERCIRSISHQAHISSSMFEIILVDDGSIDKTHEVISCISELENLRVITNDKNIGLPSSLNKAIKQARGRYIIRVDSDDYIARETLYVMQLFLDKNRQYQAVACDYVLVNQNEQPIRRANSNEEEIACGIMFRKECLFEIGLYDEGFKMREGHNLRQRFISKFNIAHLEFPFYKYRDHSENRTKNQEQVKQYDQKLKEN